MTESNQGQKTPPKQDRPKRRLFCKSCKKKTWWTEAQALDNTYTSSPDFVGDEPFEDGCTITKNGPAVLRPVIRCTECGRALSIQEPTMPKPDTAIDINYEALIEHVSRVLCERNDISREDLGDVAYQKYCRLADFADGLFLGLRMVGLDESLIKELRQEHCLPDQEVANELNLEVTDIILDPQQGGDYT